MGTCKNQYNIKKFSLRSHQPASNKPNTICVFSRVAQHTGDLYQVHNYNQWTRLSPDKHLNQKVYIFVFDVKNNNHMQGDEVHHEATQKPIRTEGYGFKTYLNRPSEI